MHKKDKDEPIHPPVNTTPPPKKPVLPQHTENDTADRPAGPPDIP